MPKLGPDDLHLIFDRQTRRCKLFDAAGNLRYTIEMRNDTVLPGFGHFGHLPAGNYRLEPPSYVTEVPFGFWFTPIHDAKPSGILKLLNRRGIGIHGGGSGLKQPFAPRQGWARTHGCLRVQNKDNARLVQSIQFAQKNGGVVWLSCLGSVG